jgi:hypothetical protein
MMSMGETYNIAGARYVGTFRAERRTGTIRGKEYSGDTPGYWYKGPGIIEDRETKEKYFFLLNTDPVREKDYTLEQSVVNFGQREQEVVVLDGNYPKIIDLSLGHIVSQIRDSEEKIPTVKPTKLELASLIEQGEQLHLPTAIGSN